MPSDYGVVAMAHLLVGLVFSLLDFGATTALLRKDSVTREEVDSAWTLKAIQGLAMAVLLLAFIPVGYLYFEDSRIETILYVFAICIAINGFSNIGLTLAQKKFDFLLEFKFQLSAKLLGVLVTVIAGWWLRDYRALVIGIATGYIGGTILSFWMHPYRPRWNTNGIGAIWKVTRWLMLANVGGFVLRKGDELVAARIGSAGEFGMYNVGSDLGQMATGEVGPAILKSFLPVLAAMSGVASEINAAVLKTLRAVAAVTLPLGFGLAALSVPVTQLLLGSAWQDAAQYVATFALVGALYALAGPFSSLLTLRGETKGLSQAVWFEFIVFLISSIILLPTFGLMGLVLARLCGAAVNLIFISWLASQKCGVSFGGACGAIGRPLIGAILMYLAASSVLIFLDGEALSMLLVFFFGVLFFSVWCLVTWWIVGRPDGLESTLLELFRGWRFPKIP